MKDEKEGGNLYHDSRTDFQNKMSNVKNEHKE